MWLLVVVSEKDVPGELERGKCVLRQISKLLFDDNTFRACGVCHVTVIMMFAVQNNVFSSTFHKTSPKGATSFPDRGS